MSYEGNVEPATMLGGFDLSQFVSGLFKKAVGAVTVTVPTPNGPQVLNVGQTVAAVRGARVNKPATTFTATGPIDDVAQPSSTPGWVLPAVGIGLAVLLLGRRGR